MILLLPNIFRDKKPIILYIILCKFQLLMIRRRENIFFENFSSKLFWENLTFNISIWF